MTSAFSRLPDASPPDPATRPHLASWYTPGLSDALGDRLLMFDNTTASPLELLRFKPGLSRTPGFEDALRRRVDELAAFEHESIGTIRAVKRLGEPEALALVSNQVVGRRLSEVLGEVQGASLAIELIRQLTPVLAALHERGIAHGALTPHRIIITPEGGLVLIEHVLGSALDTLNMSCGWMRSELGIAVPAGDGHMPLDARTDIVQLGFIALSLAAGKRLDAAIYPDKIGDVFSAAVAAGAIPPPLRRWLERALHLTWPPFASGLDAAAAFEELPPHQDRSSQAFPALPSRPVEADVAREPASNVVSIRQFTEKPSPDRAPDRTTSPPPVARYGLEPVVDATPAWPVEPAAARSALEPPPFVPPPPPRAPEPQAFTEELFEHIPPDPASPLIPVEAPPAPFFPDENDLPLRPPQAGPLFADEFRRLANAMPAAPAKEKELPPQSPRPPAAATGFVSERSEDRATVAAPVRAQEPRRKPIVKWLIAALVAVAILEGVIISGLLSRDEPSPPAAVENAAPDATAPEQADAAQAAQDAAPPPGRGSSTRSAAAGTANRSGAGNRSAAAAPVDRIGSVRFTSPIELEVFENGKRIGSTAGALTLASGRHTLTLVNEALGYKTTQRVDIATGRGTVRAIALPQGRLSINATPWALVSIDGKPAGETPLANLSVPIGTHQIVFRHPLLGERRETAVVKVVGVTRVHANLNR